MDQDFRYGCCLAAALTIIEFFQSNPDAPKYELVAAAVFAIVHGLDRYEAERSDRRAVEFSAN